MAATSDPSGPNCGIQNRFRFGSLPTIDVAHGRQLARDRRGVGGELRPRLGGHRCAALKE